MALPKKSSQPINVAGSDLRWASARTGGSLEIRVELDSQPSSQLLARIGGDASGAVPAVGPRLVAALVEAGLSQGWDPTQAAPREFELAGAAELAREHDLRARKELVCVVLAPFDAGAARLRDTIARAVRETGVQLLDAADIPFGDSVAEAIHDAILDADFIVADVSRQNPNVYYELGVAAALGKPTLLLVDRMVAEGIPTSLSGNFFFLYDPQNLSDLHAGLKRAVLRTVRTVATK